MWCMEVVTSGEQWGVEHEELGNPADEENIKAVWASWDLKKNSFLVPVVGCHAFHENANILCNHDIQIVMLIDTELIWRIGKKVTSLGLHLVDLLHSWYFSKIQIKKRNDLHPEWTSCSNYTKLQVLPLLWAWWRIRSHQNLLLVCVILVISFCSFIYMLWKIYLFICAIGFSIHLAGVGEKLFFL